MNEYFFQCPYCWSAISMLIDTSVSTQKYIEDCEVCCNPIELEVLSEDGEISGFQARNIEQ
ncbi:CPXCG motif-containing cysteine-rich protein [Kordia sp.]|uniref:CPXCG motif-containing cysteine-rich protein n=1 Tax=Kordia sp. TaxID=1965332 RepID=UPI003D6ADC7B